MDKCRWMVLGQVYRAVPSETGVVLLAKTFSVALTLAAINRTINRFGNLWRQRSVVLHVFIVPVAHSPAMHIVVATRYTARFGIWMRRLWYPAYFFRLFQVVKSKLRHRVVLQVVQPIR